MEIRAVGSRTLVIYEARFGTREKHPEKTPGTHITVVKFLRLLIKHKTENILGGIGNNINVPFFYIRLPL